MSAQEILIEEIKQQPEEVAREVLRYLKSIERRRLMSPGEKTIADTWEKLGPAPELDCNEL
jgi:hypothetical protein